MATPRKRTTKVKTVADENYSKLDQYSIQLNEFYKSVLFIFLSNYLNTLYIFV